MRVAQVKYQSSRIVVHSDPSFLPPHRRYGNMCMEHVHGTCVWNMCMDMCMDMCVDTYIDMCLDMCLGHVY